MRYCPILILIDYIDLLADGQYSIEIYNRLPDACLRMPLRVPSGKVFIGAGEDTTGGDFDPEPEYMSGIFWALPAGQYQVAWERRGDSNNNIIALAFYPI